MEYNVSRTDRLDNYKEALSNREYNVIPLIFCIFAEKDDTDKLKASDLLCNSLKSMSFDDLICIESQMRQTTSMEWYVDWRALSINSFFTKNMTESQRLAIIVFSSFNPNGYIREQAVRKMKSHEGTLPFAILRQNDWVPQVRAAAEKTVEYRLSNLSEGELLATLPFAEKISHGGRSEHISKYIDRIATALSNEKNEELIFDGLVTTNVRSRRFYIEMLFRIGNSKYSLVIRQLNRERDPFLRSFIFSKLFAAGQNIGDLADRFLKDKYSRNRVLAFRYFCKTDEDKASKIAFELLLDKSLVVRECVRYYIKSNIGSFDYRAFYKSHLKEETVPAVLGLGEVGNPEDALDVEQYLKADQPAILRAAMTSVMKLDNNKYAGIITEFLSDDRQGVVKTAYKLISKIGSPYYERIREVFCSTPCQKTKRKCFSLLMKDNKWQRLIYILEVMEMHDDEMGKLPDLALDSWLGNYNKAFSTPTNEQIKTITDGINKLADIIPVKVQAELLFLLR